MPPRVSAAPNEFRSAGVVQRVIVITPSVLPPLPTPVALTIVALIRNGSPSSWRHGANGARRGTDQSDENPNRDCESDVPHVSPRFSREHAIAAL